jgi:flavin-binding protein dodecin
MVVMRVTEITATSTKGIEEAIQEGLHRASKTLRGITGLEVASLKAVVRKGKIREYRVTIKITFDPEA